ncbi:MAG: hypothetical protein IM658_04240 [Phenylobacterium sp.]|nr:hypothetical protein [Phenylobacterium sp.]
MCGIRTPLELPPRKAQDTCACFLFRGLDTGGIAVLIILLGQVTGAGIA